MLARTRTLIVRPFQRAGDARRRPDSRPVRSPVFPVAHPDPRNGGGLISAFCHFELNQVNLADRPGRVILCDGPRGACIA